MRIVTPLLVVLLVVSALANAILFMKIRNKRPLFSVNGQAVTKKDLDDYLEQKEGPSTEAVLVNRMLVEQEAKKQGVLPTDAEVDEVFDNQKKLLWQFANEMNSNVWKAQDTKNSIRTQLASRKLQLKDIKVSDEDIKKEYNRAPAAYDTVDEMHANLVVLADLSKKAEVMEVLKKTPAVAPSAIMSQYPKVFFIGNEYKYTFQRPFQYTGPYNLKQLNDYVFAIKPGEVKEFPLTQDIKQLGGQAMIIKVLDVVPGHKADLNDPKTKEKIRQQVAVRSAKPWEETLRGLFSKMDFQSEKPEDKKNVENILFPRSAMQGGK